MAMRRPALVIWIAVILMFAADLVLCRRLGLCFYGWWRLVLGSAATAAIALFYRLTGRSDRLARTACWTLLWALFVNAGAVLTYAAAAGGGRPYDATLAALDAALGFDWTRWCNFLAPHRNLRILLWLAYLSLFPQILVSIFWFAWCHQDDSNYQLLLTNILSLLLTAALFLLVPAIGHPEPGRQRELADLLALRSGMPHAFDLSQMQGLISFPSYHTVLAVLLTWAHRRSALLPAIAAINGLMLFAIPSFGGHYLSDMIAGAGVAILAILATTALERRPAPAHIAAI